MYLSFSDRGNLMLELCLKSDRDLLRAQYHRIVTDLKKQETTNRSEKMAKSILNDDTRSFWRESKTFKPRKKVATDTVNVGRGNEQITDDLAAKCNKLCNSVLYDADAKKEIKQNIKNQYKHWKLGKVINTMD